jgi:hypothetical protein
VDYVSEPGQQDLAQRQPVDAEPVLPRFDVGDGLGELRDQLLVHKGHRGGVAERGGDRQVEQFGRQALAQRPRAVGLEGDPVALRPARRRSVALVYGDPDAGPAQP